MSDTTGRIDELHRLLSAMLDGTLTADGEARLMELVDTDDAARADYLDLLEAHAILRWENRSQVAEVMAEPVFAIRPERRFGRWAMVAVAAAVAIGGAAATIWLTAASEPTDPRSVGPAVAVVTTTRDVRWSSEPIESGGDVPAQTVAIEGGTLGLDLRSGVSLELTGRTQITLIGSGRIALERGRVTAVVPEGAEGFAVDLPGGRRVIDLGTAFGAIAEADGTRDVWVTRGRVLVVGPDGDAAAGRTLEAGQAIRLDATGVTPIAVDPYRHLGRPRSLVGLWRFDEAGELGVNEARIGGTLRATGEARFTSDGRYGGALELDGEGDALVAEAWLDGLPIGDAPYTLMAWVKPTAAGGGIVGWGGYGREGETTALRLTRDDDRIGDGVRHYWWGNDLDAAPADGGPMLGRWRHVAVTYDGQQRRVWIDGAVAAQDTPGEPHRATPESLAIGLTSPKLSEYFAGLIDDMAIYNEAIDDEHIRDAMYGRFEPGAASDE